MSFKEEIKNMSNEKLIMMTLSSLVNKAKYDYYHTGTLYKKFENLSKALEERALQEDN